MMSGRRGGHKKGNDLERQRAEGWMKGMIICSTHKRVGMIQGGGGAQDKSIKAGCGQMHVYGCCCRRRRPSARPQNSLS